MIRKQKKTEKDPLNRALPPELATDTKNTPPTE